ncbi:MAG: hypothetical protein DRH08_06540 [Deltaproteobacteria bacterium]|nr:MAG: hypothetical protein DRH08_06540 [Deltaproteobacteria bacterium]
MHLLDLANRLPSDPYLPARQLKGSPGYLYYLRVRGEAKLLYKIGYTSGTLDRRVVELGAGEATVRLVDYLEFPTGGEAYLMEQRLHLFFRESYRRFRYDYRLKGKILPSGNTELYTRDILSLPSIEVKLVEYLAGFSGMVAKRQRLRESYKRRRGGYGKYYR